MLSQSLGQGFAQELKRGASRLPCGVLIAVVTAEEPSLLYRFCAFGRAFFLRDLVCHVLRRPGNRLHSLGLKLRGSLLLIVCIQ